MISTIENEDNVSIWKFIEQYPQPQVRVELSRLERMNKDISRFSKEIQPILGVVNEITNDSVCSGEPIVGPAKISPQANSLKRREFAGRLGAGVFVATRYRQDTTVATELDTSSKLKVIAKTQKLTAQEPLRVALEKPPIFPATSDAPTSRTQQLVFTYGPFRQSLLIHELSTFAETGELSDSLRSLLKLASINPENVRTLLTREITVNLTVLDRTLNSLMGEYALFQVGQIIHTRSHQASIQALRAALVLSASDDNRISLSEFLQNYPLQQVYVDGVKLSRLMRDVKRAGGVSGFAVQRIRQLKDFLMNVQASAIGKRACKSDLRASNLQTTR